MRVEIFRHAQRSTLRAGVRFSVLLLPLLAPLASAQTAPDAGRVLEQTTPAPTPPPTSTLNLHIEERPAISLPDSETIAVTRIRVTGATRVSEETLHAAVAQLEGKTVSLAELQALAQRITRIYRDRGYLLSRAYIPAQEIKDGVVEIAVLEGRLAALRVENKSDLHGPALAALNRIPLGEPLTARDLERALLLANDTPGAIVKATLIPGARVGTSDLLVEVDPARRIEGTLSADTHGNRNTGRFRAGLDLAVNNPLALGDQLTFTALASLEDMYFVRAGYHLPVNRWGTRIGVSYAWLDYALGEQFAALDADGTAQIASLHVKHPFVRSRSFNLYGELQYEHKELEDRLGAFDIESDKELHDWTLGIVGSFVDSGGRGSNAFAVRYTHGDLSLDPITQAIDAATARTSGNFGKWTINLQRAQPLTPSFSLYLSYLGQFADGNLDSAEKLSLGGAYAVRAYPQGEAPGDEIHLFTLEARWRAPIRLHGEWTFSGFVDHGEAKINHSPWDAGDNRRELTGAGVGLNVELPAGFSIRGNLAWRVGNERPQGDRDRAPRAWMYAAKHF